MIEVAASPLQKEVRFWSGDAAACQIEHLLD
jgi:hypothetical protein